MSSATVRLCARDAAELSRAVLAAAERFRIRVHGQSMRPFIRDRDTIVIARTPAAELRRGDIVGIVTPNGRLLIHRLTRARRQRDGLRLITRGDARGEPDPPAGHQQVVGRVVEIERGGQTHAPVGVLARWAGLAWSETFRGTLFLRRITRRVLLR